MQHGTGGNQNIGKPEPDSGFRKGENRIRILKKKPEFGTSLL
jgi:hypothetical protein